MTTLEKVAHLKGVMEGMEYDTTTKEGKLLSLLVDIVSALAEEVNEIEDDLDTLFDFADELDEDLGDVEDYLFGDDDCDCCDDDDDCDCCDCCDEDFYEVEYTQE